jgi:hypothetical protein
VCVLALVALVLAAQSSPTGDTHRDAKLPLAFVANAGQTDESVRYMAREAGKSFYFTPRKAVLDFHRAQHGLALELRFKGANPHPEIVAERPAAGHFNFIVGSQRQTNLATYEQLRYKQLWPGIDMVFRGQGGQFKYEFLVRPGANPSDIRLAYVGADSLTLAGNGSLAIATPLGTLHDAVPRSFQGDRRVSSSYAVSGSTYGFAIGSYDRSRPLVIDPGLLYSTYLGGTDEDTSETLDVDAAGNAYVTGQTLSASFPTTPGAYDTVLGGAYDVYVTKLDSAGALIYATYLGGSGDEYYPKLAVSTAGNVYIAGATTSNDYPTTPGAFDPTHDPGDYFVTKLNAAGTGLLYSTNFQAEVTGVALAPDGGLYLGAIVAGPRAFVSPSAADATINAQEGLLVKLNPSGNTVDWATYIGGQGDDLITRVVADASGSVYATGETRSMEGFPLTPGAYDTTNEGGNVFVSKVTPDGTAFSYSTLLGTGLSSQANAIDVDSSGHAYVTGLAQVPATPGSYGDWNGTFTTKLNSTGTGVVFSARVYGNDLAVDASGAVYIVGLTDNDGPIATPGAFDSTRDGNDAYVLKLNPSATGLAYGTYFGGSGTDIGTAIEAAGGGAFIIAGYTNSTDLPTTPGSHDSSFNGVYDGFVAKLQSYDGYPRPKGAGPLYIPLVTAYEQCFGGSRTHGPPLVHSSCNPPQMRSDFLTVGTGDSNGLPARNDGYMRFDVLAGNPATPADEADVKVGFFLDDIFNKDLTDYTGELRPTITVRITDRDGPDSVMSTEQDFLLPFVAPCTPNPDSLEGSACALTTTIESIYPGVIREGRRTIWRIEDLEVYDGGPDGDADTVPGQTLFARRGVFVP